jgi:hypothetical protein
MELCMWTYDLAREQAPTLDHMRIFCDTTLEGGYNAIGLYLEHRFAYPSTPWSHGKGCLTPEMVVELQAEYPQIQIIPFVNLLGHFEGMIYTEYGKRFREERLSGMQACPSCPEFVELARTIIDDALGIFTSHIVHIGGDETQQLGKCPRCAARVAEAEGRLQSTLHTSDIDGKAVLYGEHFGPLARYVADQGRRPAVWGDMYLEHPSALDYMPKETLIFDWQYFQSPKETTRKFQERGFEVVCCPTLQTYNASWFHIEQSEQNGRQAIEAATELNAFGVCVTTWECALFGNYETLLPAIRACGEMIGCTQSNSSATLVEAPDLSDPKLLQLSPNDQISQKDIEEEGDMSISKAVTTTILARILESGHSLLIRNVSDEVTLTALPSGASQGSLPLDLANGPIRALLLLANIDPLRTSSDRVGVIKGTYRGIEFALPVEATGDTRVPDLRITNPMAVPSGPSRSNAEGCTAILDAYRTVSSSHGEWAQLMGIELQTAGGLFAPTGIRSSLKVRLLLQANPFLAWLHHHEELTGEVGDKALAILDRAISIAPDSSCRGVSEFVRGAIEFVRYADQSRQAYANNLPGVATSALAPCRQIFDNMEKTARANHLKIGGSLADIERCRVAREHVERVMKRIKEFGDGSLGYLPAFEYISHPKFVPHDQAAWWLINRWANE